eukprot:TRINITY_DN3991_c0_g2_i1.p1 TRINITY_DN3991_c0_g2~~TRINITY_DN3991_c0_g2_i1.p1  ORF type:complete len:716 (+),score=193.90 TRINITY_DN3991_c0_g2_i1:60-2150(+)
MVPPPAGARRAPRRGAGGEEFAALEQGIAAALGEGPAPPGTPRWCCCLALALIVGATWSFSRRGAAHLHSRAPPAVPAVPPAGSGPPAAGTAAPAGGDEEDAERFGGYAALAASLRAVQRDMEAVGLRGDARRFRLAVNQLEAIASALRSATERGDAPTAARMREMALALERLLPEPEAHRPLTPPPPLKPRPPPPRPGAPATPAPAPLPLRAPQTDAADPLPFNPFEPAPAAGGCSGAGRRRFCEAALGRGVWSVASKRFLWEPHDVADCGFREFEQAEARNLLQGDRVLFVGGEGMRLVFTAAVGLLLGGVVAQKEFGEAAGGLRARVSGGGLEGPETLGDPGCGIPREEWAPDPFLAVGGHPPDYEWAEGGLRLRGEDAPAPAGSPAAVEVSFLVSVPGEGAGALKDARESIAASLNRAYASWKGVNESPWGPWVRPYCAALQCRGPGGGWTRLAVDWAEGGAPAARAALTIGGDAPEVSLLARYLRSAARRRFLVGLTADPESLRVQPVCPAPGSCRLTLTPLCKSRQRPVQGNATELVWQQALDPALAAGELAWMPPEQRDRAFGAGATVIVVEGGLPPDTCPPKGGLIEAVEELRPLGAAWLWLSPPHSATYRRGAADCWEGELRRTAPKLQRAGISVAPVTGPTRAAHKHGVVAHDPATGLADRRGAAHLAQVLLNALRLRREQKRLCA